MASQIVSINISDKDLIIKYTGSDPPKQMYKCVGSSCTKASDGTFEDNSCGNGCDPLPPTPPTPPTPPSGGTCKAIAPPRPGMTEWCANNCTAPCSFATCPVSNCKWDPCGENTCDNGGTCTSTGGGSSYKCSCEKCYSGKNCSIPTCSTGCDGGDGCSIKTGSASCECDCDSRCYTLNSTTKKCDLKSCGECVSPAKCECVNGELTCNKHPPLDKYLVGYFCPSCPAFADLSKQTVMSKKYNVICIAFINNEPNGHLNVNIKNCWGGATQSSGSSIFKIDCPDRDYITELKQHGKKVVGSIGGGLGAIVKYSYMSDSYITNFVTDAISLIKLYNLDGVDLDLENRNGVTSQGYETIALVFREIAVKIKNEGYIVTSAPQCANIGQCTGVASTAIGAGANELAALFGTPSKQNIKVSNGMTFNINGATDANPFWCVFPQMYNSSAQAEDTVVISSYYKALTTSGYIQTGTYASYTVKFSNSNFILGFPASVKSASTGYIDPSVIVDKILKTNPGIRGAMTWDLFGDAFTNWNFNNTIGTYLGL